MKKLAKTLAICAIAGTMCAGMAALSACGEKAVTGEAYGLVHGAGYVGCATVTVKGDKVTDATLSEVCLPTYVEAGESVAEADKVEDTVINHGSETKKTFYKTVSYGNVTLTYTVGKGYMNGETSFADMMKTEANAKAYYEAVNSNSVSVTIGTEKKKDILNKASLSKEENGYWTDANGSKLEAAQGQTYWMANRNATIKYVKEHGVANLLKLERNSETNLWMDGTISTGATWTDFKTKKDGYISYAQLIVNAHTAATK